MRDKQANYPLDDMDKRIINQLQDGLDVCDRPYLKAAQSLGIEEDELITRLQTLLDNKVLSRFGPMYHAEKMGGGLALAAMRIPEQDFERVCEQVNAFEEIAHNYQREHEFNMWFVIATERLEDIETVQHAIESQTGYPVFCMPKIEEFYVGLRFNA